MSNIFIKNINDLIEIQRISFYNFLYTNIINELKNLPNPIWTHLNINKKKKQFIPILLYLYINEIKIIDCLYSITDCLQHNLSYTINFYIPIEYTLQIIDTLLITKNINFLRITQNFFFGTIPLMTDEGTFIINGCEKIIIHQIIRSPGIYFNKILKKNSFKINYIATLISFTGTWLQIVLETNNNKNLISFSVETLNNLNNSLISTNFNSKIFLYDFIKFFGLSITEFSESLTFSLYLKTYFTNYLITDNNTLLKKNYKISQIFKKINTLNYYLNPFYIGDIGRFNLNNRLNLKIPTTIHTVTFHDLVKIIDELINLKYFSNQSDELDTLKHKIIKSIGSILQNIIRITIYTLSKQKSFKNAVEYNSAIKKQNVNNLFKKKGTLNFKKFINFHFFLKNSKKIFFLYLKPKYFKKLIDEFFNSSELSQYMDQTNPLSELSQKRRISLFGKNGGLKRETPNIEIRNIHPSQYGRICPIETAEGNNVGLISNFALGSRINKLGFIETPYISTNLKKILFLNVQQESQINIISNNVNLTLLENVIPKSLLKFTFISVLQIISIGISLIPFLEHNDSNRLLMGASMLKQAIALLYPQKTLVGTGLEPIISLDSFTVIKSYSEGKIVSADISSILIKDNFNQLIIYFLRRYNKTNQNNIFHQKPIVWPGEKIYSNQIIADGASTNDGELALGQNLLLGYLPWEGYNYEDAIVINERLVLNDLLTSLSIKEYKVKLNNYSDILLNKIISNSSNNIQNLSPEGIILLGSNIKENDTLINKISILKVKSFKLFILESLETKENQLNKFTYSSILAPKSFFGKLISIFITKHKNHIILSFYVIKKQKIKVGDKLSGRYGNKGIIAKIISQHDMPFLPDGTTLDILLNPLGVPSRMNIGQLFESLLGFASSKLGVRFKVLPFDEIYGINASRILINQKLKQSAILTKSNWIFNNLYPGKIFLQDGRTGDYFDNPITIGKHYILKLIHLVDDKIQARSIGPYNLITDQPIIGKSKKGGQRFGEMEVWALEAFGCSLTLQEILTLKSDNEKLRVEAYNAICIGNKLPKTAYLSNSFLLLIRELNALGLNFSCNKIIKQNYNTYTKKKLNVFKYIEKRLNLKFCLKYCFNNTYKNEINDDKKF